MKWLPVVGYEGLYEVSYTGLVRSVDRVVIASNGIPRTLKGKLIVARQNVQTGYPQLVIYKDGKGIRRHVHTLVLEAFVGPRPDGLHACHRNDNPTDNRLENLRWDTRSANARDCVRNGLHARASASVCKNGHEYTPENTYWCRSRRTGMPSRQCRACQRSREKRYLQKIKECNV